MSAESPPRPPRPEPALLAGSALATLIVAVALLAVVWTPYPAEALNLAARLSPPSAAHPFGTDAYGRDVLSQVMAGAGTALLVAGAACLMGLGLGAPLGLLAAARRGLVDELVMRSGDLVFAFPAILVAVLLAAALGPGVADAVIAIGLSAAPVFARVARTGALRLWALDFTRAAQAAGRGRMAITLDHVAPNLAPALGVQAALQLSLAVVAEAGLAFIGLSAQPPQPSWGRMLADAETLYASAPWLAVFPGLAIATTVAAFSLLGEGLRRRLERP